MKMIVYIIDCQQNVRSVVDADGKFVQQTDYYPYGMPKANSNGQGVNRYKYSSKEYETENGLNLYDFEARMHDPATCLFRTTDPKASDYPWLNPYLYCAANPIAYIDPTGEDYYEVDIDGHFTLTKKTDDAFDRIYSTMGDRPHIDVDKAFFSSAKEVSGTGHSKTYGDNDAVVVKIYSNVDNLTEIHDFLTNNTDVEWSLMKMTDNSSGKEFEIMGTSNLSGCDYSADAILDIAKESKFTIDMFWHNHTIPNSQPSQSDIGMLKKISKHSPNAIFMIRYPGYSTPPMRYFHNTRTADQIPPVTVYGRRPQSNK